MQITHQSDRIALDEFLKVRVDSVRKNRKWDRRDFPKNDPCALQRWQSDFRVEFSRLLGGVTDWDCLPLNAHIIESRKCDGYIRETVHFETQSGMVVNAYFLIPDGCTAPRPAMLCLPGHGRGVDTLVGIAVDGSERPMGEPEEYAGDFALQCVAHGFPTLAMEMIGFGERRTLSARSASADVSSCHAAATTALALGETLAGWRVFDAMRALDYLQSRTEVVCPEKIGIMGISGGAMIALFTAALDERISATVLSCYWNSFADSILSLVHCVDNYIPGLSKLCEMSDLAALVAPRSLFAESGSTDIIFPVEAFRESCIHARDIYKEFGAPVGFQSEEFVGGHEFHGVQAFEFLSRWQSGSD